MTTRRTLLLALLVAALQIGFLSWMIYGRAAIMRDGREVLLKVEPVDPRDFLRGDYVRLGYDIALLPSSLFSNPPTEAQSAAAEPVLVRLAQQSDGYWRPVSATVGDTPTQPAQADQVDLRGMLNGYLSSNADGLGTVGVDYGIERYYVPQGEGLEIEKNMAIRPFGILLAVADDGTPQIKALMDGDVKLYEEPPY